MFIYASINDCIIGDQQGVYYYTPVVNKTIPTLASKVVDVYDPIANNYGKVEVNS